MPIWVIVWLVLTALYGVIAVAGAGGQGIAATLLAGVVLFLVIGGLRLLGAIFMGQRIGAEKAGSKPANMNFQERWDTSLQERRDTSTQRAPHQWSMQLPLCPFCAEPIKPKAQICRYCQRELPAGWADKADKEEIGSQSVTLLPCPFCAEPIKPKAKICRYCQHELPVGWAEKEQEP
jgi:RNA polymerase subunit RPABC4/transcription elongation factor Spt4